MGTDARFTTESEYPEFAWKEIIVNAIAHRDYSIKGTDIQIKMFDDHITVESPGTLPGTVRLNNMRDIHFSRNPKIAQLLHEYEYVREFGEGVDRMNREMEEAGLPAPEYTTVSFMVHATIKNKNYVEGKKHLTPQVTPQDTPQVTPQVTPQDKILAFCVVPRSKSEIMSFLGYSDSKHFTDKYLKPLIASNKLKMTIPDKPNSKNQKYLANT